MTDIDNIVGAGVGIIGGFMLLNYAGKMTKQLQKEGNALKKRNTKRRAPPRKKRGKRQMDYGGEMFKVENWMP